MTQEEEQPQLPPSSPIQDPAPLDKPKRRKTRILHEQLLQRLPSHVRRALRASATAPAVPDPEESEYHRLRKRLTGKAKAALDRLGPAPEPSHNNRPEWCLCESADEEFLRIRIFDSPEKLARYLASLENKEVSVWPFFGTPMRLTKAIGGQRYLLLPGEKEAIPIKATGRLEPVDASLLGLEELLDEEAYQTEGWMGHPSLSETSTGEFNLGNVEAKRSRKRRDRKEPPPKPWR